MTTLVLDTIKLKVTTVANRSSYTPAAGELLINSESNGGIKIFAGNGTTAGGKDITAHHEGRLAALETLMSSDDINLDELQELVNAIKDIQGVLTSGGAVVDWSSIVGVPTEFQPSAHNHNWASIVNKPSFSDAATTTVSAIRSGTTKSHVGLSNVENKTAAQIVATITSIESPAL